MHNRRYRIRNFLGQPLLWLRVCCMVAVLLGSQYFVLSSLAAVEGLTHTPPRGRRVQALLPALRSTGMKISTSAASLKTAIPAVRAGKGNVDQHVGGAQSQEAQEPDLAINVQADAATYLPGTTVNYTLTVSNGPAAGVVSTGGSVTVTDLIPLGLSNIVLATANVQAWTFTITDTTSPSLIVATYTGTLPIAPDATLPAIHIGGTVMLQAGPSLINVSSVNATGDPISSNNMAIVDVTVLAAVSTPLPTLTLTQLPTFALTATPTLTAISISTVVPTPVPTATSTPTVVPTLTPTPTTTPTLTPTPTTTPTLIAAPTAITTGTPSLPRPALVVTQTTSGGKNFIVGQPVQYMLLVRNLPVAGAEQLPITLTDFVRPGLAHLVPTGSNWNFSVSATNSPATIFARYTGAYPVMPGLALPPITLTGVLTAEAVPELTNTAVVTSSDNPGVANVDTTSETVFVAPIAATSAAGSPVPTATPSTFGSPSPVTPPNLAVAAIHLNGDSFRVGDQISTVLIVHDLAQAGPVVFPNPVSVTYILPVGATNLMTHGQGWSFVLSATTSPAVMSAFYSGHFPIGTGNALPAITLTATLTADAIPRLTGTAIVDTPGNVSTSSLFTDTLFVAKQRVSCPGIYCNSGNAGTGQGGTQTPGTGGSNGSGNSGSGNSGSNGSGNNGSGSNEPGQFSSGGSPGGNSPGLPGTGSDPNL